MWLPVSPVQTGSSPAGPPFVGVDCHAVTHDGSSIVKVRHTADTGSSATNALTRWGGRMSRASASRFGQLQDLDHAVLKPWSSQTNDLKIDNSRFLALGITRIGQRQVGSVSGQCD